MGQKSDKHGNNSKQGIDISYEKMGLRFQVNPLELQTSQVRERSFGRIQSFLRNYLAGIL